MPTNPLIRAYHNYKVKTVKERMQHDLRVAKKKNEKQAIEDAAMHLTAFYEATEMLDELAKLLEEMVADEKAELGPQNPRVCTTLGRLAFTYERLGNLAKAEEQLSEILDIMRKTRAKPALLLQQINVLALLCVKQKKYERAEALYRECLELLEAEGEALDARTSVMGNLATLYLRWGQYEKALEYLEREKDLVAKFFGADSVMICRPMTRMAQLFAEWPGKMFDAIKTYEEVLQRLSRADVPDLRYQLSTLEAIAECADKVDDQAKLKWAKEQMQVVAMREAEKMRDRIAQRLSTEAADHHPSRVELDIQRDLDVIKLNIEQLKTAPGKEVKAHVSVVSSFIQRLNNKKAFEEALQMFGLLIKALDARSSDVAPDLLFTPLMNSAFLCIRMEKWDEARKWYSRALAVAEKHLAPIQLAQAAYDIGHLLINHDSTKEEGLRLYERASALILQMHEQGKMAQTDGDDELSHITTGPVLGAYALTGRSAVAFMLRKMANDFVDVEQARANALSVLNVALLLLRDDCKNDETRPLATIEINVAMRAKAAVYVKMNDSDLAAEVLGDAVAELVKLAEHSSAQPADLKTVIQEHLVQTYVELAELQTDFAERKATVEKAIAVAKQHFGESSSLYLEARMAHAKLLMAQQDWAAAKTILNEIIQAQDEVLFPFDPRRSEALAMLKEVCVATNDTEMVQELEKRSNTVGIGGNGVVQLILLL